MWHYTRNTYILHTVPEAANHIEDEDGNDEHASSITEWALNRERNNRRLGVCVCVCVGVRMCVMVMCICACAVTTERQYLLFKYTSVKFQTTSKNIHVSTKWVSSLCICACLCMPVPVCVRASVSLCVRVWRCERGAHVLARTFLCFLVEWTPVAASPSITLARSSSICYIQRNTT